MCARVSAWTCLSELSHGKHNQNSKIETSAKNFDEANVTCFTAQAAMQRAEETEAEEEAKKEKREEAFARWLKEKKKVRATDYVLSWS
jgi:hypothetical protein